MERVLIIASDDKKAQTLVKTMETLEGFVLDYAITIAEATEKYTVIEYDLIIINTPLKEELGTELILHIAENTLSAILVLVEAEKQEEVQEKLLATGALVLPKPVSKTVLIQSIPFVLNSKLIIQTLRMQNKKLKQKIDDIKYIERAKYTLIQYLGYDEENAHRYIQKQAMDRRITPREVANTILKMYAYKH